MGLASTSLSYRFRLRSATVFDFAQLPFSTSLSYRFRFRSVTVFGFSQLPWAEFRKINKCDRNEVIALIRVKLEK
ncbi:hypothetical protein [Emticicia oligotrophica]|uniref:hypothetical protein n=1 Tax=Emticicia oligotrophica TaxID=312279 RepID=UPI0030EBF869